MTSTEAGAMSEQIADAAHATPRQYVIIAAVLAVITALEVSLYYLEGEIASGLIIALLLAMAAVKFVLVASWYMHLRTDRLMYRRVFVVGAAGAIFLYLIVLLTFQVFDR